MMTEPDPDSILSATMATPRPAPVAAEVLADAVRLAEAMVFAASAPLSARALGNLLPAGVEPEAVVAALRQAYAGRGVELAEVAGGLQFRTASDLAPRLRRVVVQPRRLPRAAMETLSIIAYHQPVTRAEIEEIRGASLSQSTLDTLLEQGLVAPKGRKEAPGRPTLWATTTAFLAQFGLKDLRELPRREDLLVEPPSPQQGPEAAGPDAASPVAAGPEQDGAAEDGTAQNGTAQEGPAQDGGAEDARQADGRAPAGAAQEGGIKVGGGQATGTT